VETVLREEALAAVGQIAGALTEPAPYVLFTPGPGELGLGFQVTFPIAGFTVLQATQSEMRKRLFTRLKGEGIRMNPVRVIHSDAGKVSPGDG